jgi:hypothetical protein
LGVSFLRFTIAKQTGYAMKVRIILPFCLYWLLGSGLGFWIFTSQQTLYSSLMRSAMICSVSIVRLVPIVIFPFLVCILASLVRKPVLIYFTSMVCGLVFGLCAFAIHNSVYFGGWLLQLLVMFSVNAVSVMLLFSVQNIHEPSRLMRTAFVSLLICLVFVFIDFSVISRMAISSIL